MILLSQPVPGTSAQETPVPAQAQGPSAKAGGSGQGLLGGPSGPKKRRVANITSKRSDHNRKLQQQSELERRCEAEALEKMKV